MFLATSLECMWEFRNSGNFFTTSLFITIILQLFNIVLPGLLYFLQHGVLRLSEKKNI